MPQQNKKHNTENDDIFNVHSSRETIIVFGSDQHPKKYNNDTDNMEFHEDHEQRQSQISFHNEMKDIDLKDDMFMRHSDQIDQNLRDNVQQHTLHGKSKKLHNQLFVMMIIIF